MQAIVGFRLEDISQKPIKQYRNGTPEFCEIHLAVLGQAIPLNHYNPYRICGSCQEKLTREAHRNDIIAARVLAKYKA